MQFFVDALLNLAYPHTGQAVDRTDLLKSHGTSLSCNHRAIVAALVSYPISARAAFTLDVVSCMRREASIILDDIVFSIHGERTCTECNHLPLGVHARRWRKHCIQESVGQK
jgi:hypothetical protein